MLWGFRKMYLTGPLFNNFGQKTPAILHEDVFAFDMIRYIIYLLTAIGLTLGGSGCARWRSG